MGNASLVQGAHPGIRPAEILDHATRLRALVAEHFDFIWRSLRRLGVPPADLDDAAQQVLMVVSRKLSSIDPEREKSFVFQTAFRVASDVRRAHRRRREVVDPSMLERVDTAPGPEAMAEHKRARELLDALLEEMDLDLRAVFVLFEIEELSSIEIARLLEVPVGTVASRLRRARADFQARVSLIEGAHRGVIR
ncbi:MAG TPA: sigma-70 family RNA polymerase sigma factor [Polyangiaceae bacterium]|nr:sigma-70 family RNA polymerase sigma factor [Polyangiaceae bacterium]